MATMMIVCDTTPDNSADVVGLKADVLKAAVSVTSPQPSAVKWWKVARGPSSVSWGKLPTKTTQPISRIGTLTSTFAGRRRHVF
ncbi:hypothetical protein TNCV_4692601 [Trichonephila clavipes]|nr:hypothetical protein TNCV_4692601 [Trichonephila clavipes]